MKKTLFFMMILAVLATGCKKDNKSKSLNYNDSDPIVMSLSGPEHIQNIPTHYFDHKLQVTSDYDITYSAINPDSIEVIKVSSDGYIHGKNVGEAKVKLDNGYESKTVDVTVDLFIEPTFDFGCNASKIWNMYGNPYYQVELPGDTVLVYLYTSNHGYSYACGEMDFFFLNGSYYESDVFIRPSVEYLMNNYLNDNFRLDTILGDTLSVYRYKLDESIICGKFASHNQWNEWCLFYIQLNQEKSLANILKRRPRSPKFLY